MKTTDETVLPAFYFAPAPTERPVFSQLAAFSQACAVKHSVQLHFDFGVLAATNGQSICLPLSTDYVLQNDEPFLLANRLQFSQELSGVELDKMLANVLGFLSDRGITPQILPARRKSKPRDAPVAPSECLYIVVAEPATHVRVSSTHCPTPADAAEPETEEFSEVIIRFKSAEVVYTLRLHADVEKSAVLRTVRVTARAPPFAASAFSKAARRALFCSSECIAETDEVLEHQFALQLARELLVIVKSLASATLQRQRVATPGYFYPALLGDEVASIREHYEIKRTNALRFSSIKVVRRVNNRVKGLMIRQFTPRHSDVLDLACGHGQDIRKFYEVQPRTYIGIDISNTEIDEARRRLSELLQSGLDALKSFRFHVGNMLLPASYERFLLQRENPTADAQLPQFQVLSVQLAIHYCLSDYGAAASLLQRFAALLAPGGVFYGSTVCSFEVARRCMEGLKVRTRAQTVDERLEFGNAVYRVSFPSETLSDYFELQPMADGGVRLGTLTPECRELFPETASEATLHSLESVGYAPAQVDAIRESPVQRMFTTTWGLKYRYWLTEHIDEAEYVVPWLSFCRLCAEFGLHCEFRQNFLEYYEAGAEGRAELAEALHASVEQLLPQLECSSVYHAFVFRKCAD